MNIETFRKAEDLQDKIANYKTMLNDWAGHLYEKALQRCESDVLEAMTKLFNDKVNEKIAKLQKEFKEL